MSRQYETELTLEPFELKAIAKSPEILSLIIKTHEAAADSTQYVPVRARHMARVKELLPLYEKALLEATK